MLPFNFSYSLHFKKNIASDCRRIAEAKIAAQNKEKRQIEQKAKKEIKNKDDELMARLANLKGSNIGLLANYCFFCFCLSE